MLTLKMGALALLLCATAWGQGKSAGTAKQAAGDTPKSRYHYYFHVDVSDGVEMEQIWESFTDCLRGHRYRFMRGVYVWGPGTTGDDGSGDSLPSDGSIDKDGTDAIVGPFNSMKEMEAALDNVKECLNIAARKAGVETFSHGLMYFKLEK